MKIGILTDSYEPVINGVSTSIKSLQDGLEALGHDVYIITTNALPVKKETNPKVIRIKGIKPPLKGFKGFRFPLRYKKGFKHVKKLNLDVMHIHTEFQIGKLARYSKKKLDIPMVYTMHTMYETYVHHVSKFLAKHCYKWSIKTITKWLNKYTKNSEVSILPTTKVLDIAKKYNLDGNFKIVQSGVPLEPFYKDTYSIKEVNELKKELQIEDKFVLLFVGRVSNEKSIDLLIDAYKEFLKTNPNSVFVVIGDGPAYDKLVKYAKSLGLEDNIKFLGFVYRDKIGLYYQIANVFINASTTETQGLTYVEAQAASLPCVVRYDKVFDNFIIDNENGLFFNTKEELVEKLNLLYNDKALQEKLANNAKKSALPYSQEVYANKCVELYEEAIELNKKTA